MRQLDLSGLEQYSVIPTPVLGLYRVGVRHNRLDIYERVGPDAEDMVARFSESGLGDPGLFSRLRADQERYGQFTPVMRFILADADERTFGVQRMCYLGSIDDWIDISHWSFWRHYYPEKNCTTKFK